MTGDLLDKPDPKYCSLFEDFVIDLKNMTNNENPVIVPGNHDVKRVIGSFFRDARYAVSSVSNRVVVDTSLRVIFLCFDSSRKGFLSCGRITDNQMEVVGRHYENELRVSRACDGYLPVALLHHHTLTYNNDSDKRWWQIGLGNELTIRLHDADRFLEWCHGYRIETVLHGHRHIPRHLVDTVRRNNESVEITTVGCGPSLGVNGHALCYDTIEWDPKGGRIISFYKSTGSGSFQEEVLEIKRNVR